MVLLHIGHIKNIKMGAKSAKDAMEQKLQIFRNIIELNEETNTPEEFITSVKKIY